MRKNHILILGDVDSVKEYLDFFENQYSLIVSEYEYTFMPSSIRFAAKAVYKVKTPDHFDATCLESNMELILSYLDEIVAQHGPIDHVVCTHEHTVLPAAVIRSRLGIQGLQESQALSLRDKYIMKTRISTHGIATPGFAYLEKNSYQDQIQMFLSEYGKIVLKPINQAGSHGILVTSDVQSAIQHVQSLLREANEVAVEQYIDLPVMHFDGVASDGTVQFLSVSKKIGNCYDYVNDRESLSTIIMNDPQLYQRAKNYVEKCLSALQIDTIVFHLELFADQLDHFVFLEIAGRYPGAGITDLIKKVFAFDLVEASYRIDCRLPIDVHYSETLIREKTPTAMLLLPSPVKKTIFVRGVVGCEDVPRNVVGSEICGPGNRVDYSPIDAFKAIARFYISDSDVEKIEHTIHLLESQINFIYDEGV